MAAIQLLWIRKKERDENPPLLVAEHDDAADEGDGGDGEEVGVGDHLAQVY